MNEAVAIIPARGGRKRIPRKNIREFQGKPIIAYSIETARRSQGFARIVVSTDDDEISGVAQRFGAETPFMRPASLAEEHTGAMEVVKHAIEGLEQSGAAFDGACCIYATAPFLSACYLTESFLCLEPSDRFLPDRTLDAIWPEHRAIRSQDLEPAYHDAGQFSPESAPVVLPRELLHDIDKPEDWANAELPFAALRLAGGRRQ